jgi:hypothetical protein
VMQGTRAADAIGCAVVLATWVSPFEVGSALVSLNGWKAN